MTKKQYIALAAKTEPLTWGEAKDMDEHIKSCVIYSLAGWLRTRFTRNNFNFFCNLIMHSYGSVEVDNFLKRNHLYPDYMKHD